MRRWLDDNPWESEDGPTLKYLCQRDYHWTVPMCWIGDDLLAISGIGHDDIAMLPGAQIFDVATGVELNSFAGPRGASFAPAGGCTPLPPPPRQAIAYTPSVSSHASTSARKPGTTDTRSRRTR
jgi:hypothetical protein